MLQNQGAAEHIATKGTEGRSSQTVCTGWFSWQSRQHNASIKYSSMLMIRTSLQRELVVGHFVASTSDSQPPLCCKFSSENHMDEELQ
jgi:hypothetical protein